jgi:hypothetical protein
MNQYQKADLISWLAIVFALIAVGINVWVFLR